MGNVKVSVIIPIYNAEKFLKKSLDSLLKQTIGQDAMEIILVDDGSKDSSPQICDEYAAAHSCFKVIHKPNGGASAARNTGLLAATGEYIHMLDADDWVEPNTYEVISKQMDEAEADVAHFGWYVDIPEKNGIRQVSQADNAPDGPVGQDEIFRTILIICGSAGGKVGYGNYIWNKMYRRTSLYNANGEMVLFDTNVKVAEDGLWLVEVGQNWKKGVFDHNPYYHYLRNDTSCMNTAKNFAQTRLASQASHIRMLEILKEFNMDYYKIHQEACLKFFWSTVKTPQGSANKDFVASVITNLVIVNDGRCPENVAKDVQWYIRNNDKKSAVMKRKPVQAAIKFTERMDKMFGKDTK